MSLMSHAGRFLPLLLVLLLVEVSVPAHAQSASRMTTERVRFARGGSSVVLRGGTIDGNSRRYLVNVRSGQRLAVGIENGDAPGWAVLQVYAPGRPIQARYTAPSSDGSRYDLYEWDGQLSRSGDYQIVVYPGNPDADANYELTIRVE